MGAQLYCPSSEHAMQETRADYVTRDVNLIPEWPVEFASISHKYPTELAIGYLAIPLLKDAAMDAKPISYPQDFLVGQCSGSTIHDSMLRYLQDELKHIVLVEVWEEAVLVKEYQCCDEGCSLIAIVERVVVDYRMQKGSRRSLNRRVLQSAIQ